MWRFFIDGLECLAAGRPTLRQGFEEDSLWEPLNFVCPDAPKTWIDAKLCFNRHPYPWQHSAELIDPDNGDRWILYDVKFELRTYRRFRMFFSAAHRRPQGV